MNEKHNPEHDEIRDLLVEAGPPPELPEDDLAAIRKAARREWLEMSATPIFEGRSRRTLLALAASLLVVITAVWLFRTEGRPQIAPGVATIELLRGEIETLAAGDRLGPGTELSTPATTAPVTRLALRMGSGHSVRLDSDSRIVLASATRIELEHGAVYVDSGVAGSASGLEIGTRLGTVREIGTQFEVRVDGTIRVRVREGSVTLSRGGRTFSASRGEQLMVDHRGEVDRSAVPVTGAEWSWVLETAPLPDTEDRSLATYLDWASRETGWPVRYEDPELEAMSSETVYGSFEDLTPEQVLQATLASSGLGYRIEDGTLIVTRAE